MNSRSRDGFYALWTLAIFLCIILAVFAVFFVSCQKVPQEVLDAEAAAEAAALAAEEAQASAEMAQTAPDPAAEAAPAAPVTVLAQDADQGPTYLADFVFLGDGTTYVLGSTGTLPMTQIWSTEGGTLNLSDHAATYIDYYADGDTPQEMLIYNAAAVRQPKYVVISLGLNGLTYLTEAEFKQAYTDLIQSIRTASPNTGILCQSILPVIDTLSGDVKNDRIQRANQWILDIAEETGTRYLNTAELLMDETGNLRSEYAAADGILLSEAGCQAVLTYVRTHPYI